MGATADFTQQPQTEILLGCLSHRPVHFSMTLFPSLNHLPLLAQKSRGASRLLRLRIVRRRLTKGGRGGAAGCAKITTKYSRVPYKRVCVCLHARSGECIFKMEHSSSSLCPCFSCTTLPRGNKQRSGQCCQRQPVLQHIRTSHIN